MPGRLPHLRCLIALTAATLAAVSTPGSVRAGPVPVFELLEQSRTVSATAGAEGRTPVDDETTAPDFGTFDARADAEFLDEDYRVAASARQVSVLTPVLLSFEGEVGVESEDLDPTDDVGGPVDAQAISEGSVTFRLGLPHVLRVSTTVRIPGDVSAPDEPSHNFSLVRLVGGEQETLIDVREGGPLVQTLPPGVYVFSYHHGASTFPGGPGDDEAASFRTELALAAVPLPPAAWAGAAGLALVAFRLRRAAGGSVRGTRT